MSGSDYTTTPNLGLYKPIFNKDVGNWGGHWNTNADTLDSKFGEVTNVRDYGATGNGSTYDTAAIQAAAAALPASGGTLYLPTGTYLTNGTVLIPSNTEVCGDGPATTLLGGASWASPAQFFLNQSNAATVLTDSNIIVRDLTLDYGSSSPTAGAHAIDMIYVTGVRVLHVTVQCRGAGDAVSIRGCKDTVIDGCSGYGFTNCVYDFWTKPQRARVVNCYAETASSVQMICFNPENTAAGTSSGNVADGFVLANNQFVYTSGTAACPMQLEPLETGTFVRNVVVANNIFSNVTLVMRGATSGVTITGNEFHDNIGGGEVITSYVSLGGTPADFTVTGNTVINPTTTAGNVAVIRLEGTGVVAIGNRVSGSGFGSTWGIHATAADALVMGNTASNAAGTENSGATTFTAPGTALTVANNAAIGGSASVSGGLALGNTSATGTDMSKHLTVYPSFGINATAGTSMNLIAGNTTVASCYNTGFVVAGFQQFGTMGFNGAAQMAKPTVTGARASNAALTSLLTALAAYGLVTNSTTT